MPSKVVTVQTDEGYHDSLDGDRLREGERVFIRWPAGYAQPVEVCIDVFPRGILRDGEVVTVPCHKAYIRLAVFGTVTKIYLHGFTAQRIKT